MTAEASKPARPRVAVPPGAPRRARAALREAEAPAAPSAQEPDDPGAVIDWLLRESGRN